MLISVYQWYRPERHAEKEISETFWQLLAGGLVLKWEAVKAADGAVVSGRVGVEA